MGFDLILQGKTMLVRAAAKESKCILFSCTASALTSKWHGEGEKLLRTLFAVAIDAAPSILLFDEVSCILNSFIQTLNFSNKLNVTAARLMHYLRAEKEAETSTKLRVVLRLNS